MMKCGMKLCGMCNVQCKCIVCSRVMGAGELGLVEIKSNLILFKN